jgi:hypothetical protein
VEVLTLDLDARDPDPEMRYVFHFDLNKTLLSADLVSDKGSLMSAMEVVMESEKGRLLIGGYCPLVKVLPDLAKLLRKGTWKTVAERWIIPSKINKEENPEEYDLVLVTKLITNMFPDEKDPKKTAKNKAKRDEWLEENKREGSDSHNIIQHEKTFMEEIEKSGLEREFRDAMTAYHASKGWVKEFFEGFVDNVVAFLAKRDHKKAHVAIILRTYGMEREDFVKECIRNGIMSEDGSASRVTFGAFMDEDGNNYSMGLATNEYDYTEVVDSDGSVKFKGEPKPNAKNRRAGFHPTTRQFMEQPYAEELRDKDPNLQSYPALIRALEQYAFSNVSVSPRHERLHVVFGRDAFSPWDQGRGNGGKPYVVRSPSNVEAMGGVPTISIYFDDNMVDPDALCGGTGKDKETPYIASVVTVDAAGTATKVDRMTTDLEKTQLVWMTGWDAHDKAAYFTSEMDKAIVAYNTAGTLGEDVALYKFNSAT